MDSIVVTATEGDTVAMASATTIPFDDYFSMGVEHVWLIDPIRHRGFVASRTGIEETPDGEFAVSGIPIRVILREVFAELDDMLSEV